MRYVVHRWYVVPIAAMAALYVCCVMAIDVAGARGLAIATKRVDRVYTMAKERRFEDLRKSGLVSEHDLHYLIQQDRMFGPIRDWEQEDMACLGISLSWSGYVQVHRDKVTASDSVGGGNPHTTEVALDNRLAMIQDPVERGDAEIADAKSAIARAKPMLYSLDADAALWAAKAAKIGDQWLVTVTVVKDHNKEIRMLVLDWDGYPSEHIAGGKVDYCNSTGPYAPMMSRASE